MVFIPKPTAVLSLGTETEIMFTMGIIMETTPTREMATSIVKSNVVPRLNRKSNTPTMLIYEPKTRMGLARSLLRVCL